MYQILIVFVLSLVSTACPHVLKATHSEVELPHEMVTISAHNANDIFNKSITVQAPTFLNIKPIAHNEKKQLKKKLRSLTKGLMVKEMQEPALREAANISLTLKEYDDALIYLKQLSKTTQSSTVVKVVTLEIADVMFQNGDLKTAAKLYEEYVNLYPGDKKTAAYAEYKELLSNNALRAENDRDQTATLRTIKLADALSEKQGTFVKQYAPYVQAIKNDCVSQLYNHDVVVFDYYVKKKSFKAAELRLDNIKTNFLLKRPDLEPSILNCEIRFAQAKNDTIRVAQLSDDLVKRFPEQATRVAQQTATIDYISVL